MQGKISMRIKIIIFVIAAMIGIASIVHDNMGNFKFSIASNSKKATEVDKSALVGDTKEKQIADAKVKALGDKQALEKKQALEAKQVVEMQKQKALDDEWQTGYDAYNQKKNNSECIRIMNEIIIKDDKYYKAYTLKGIAECYTSSVDYEDGIKNIDKALELKPDYGYGRFNKALALELYAKYPEAIKAYESALEVEDYIWSYYGIASIYGRYGDSKNCVYYLNFAIKQEPETIKALVKKEHDFDNVRNSKELIDAIN